MISNYSLNISNKSVSFWDRIGWLNMYLRSVKGYITVYVFISFLKLEVINTDTSVCVATSDQILNCWSFIIRITKSAIENCRAPENVLTYLFTHIIKLVWEFSSRAFCWSASQLQYEMLKQLLLFLRSLSSTSYQIW